MRIINLLFGISLVGTLLFGQFKTLIGSQLLQHFSDIGSGQNRRSGCIKCKLVWELRR